MSILDRIGGTPLVPLARVGAGLPVPVLAKCEHMNPGGSVKDRIAKAKRSCARRGCSSVARPARTSSRRFVSQRAASSMGLS